MDKIEKGEEKGKERRDKTGEQRMCEGGKRIQEREGEKGEEGRLAGMQYFTQEES